MVKFFNMYKLNHYLITKNYSLFLFKTHTLLLCFVLSTLFVLLAGQYLGKSYSLELKLFADEYEQEITSYISNLEEYKKLAIEEQSKTKAWNTERLYNDIQYKYENLLYYNSYILLIIFFYWCYQTARVKRSRFNSIAEDYKHLAILATCTLLLFSIAYLLLYQFSSSISNENSSLTLFREASEVTWHVAKIDLNEILVILALGFSYGLTIVWLCNHGTTLKVLFDNWQYLLVTFGVSVSYVIILFISIVLIHSFLQLEDRIDVALFSLFFNFVIALILIFIKEPISSYLISLPIVFIYPLALCFINFISEFELSNYSFSFSYIWVLILAIINCAIFLRFMNDFKNAPR